MASNALSTALLHFPLASPAEWEWRREAPSQVCSLYPGVAWATRTINEIDLRRTHVPVSGTRWHVVLGGNSGYAGLEVRGHDLFPSGYSVNPATAGTWLSR